LAERKWLVRDLGRVLPCRWTLATTTPPLLKGEGPWVEVGATAG
jgi:hypothetical protein